MKIHQVIISLTIIGLANYLLLRNIKSKRDDTKTIITLIITVNFIAWLLAGSLTGTLYFILNEWNPWGVFNP